MIGSDFVPQLRTILEPTQSPSADVVWITHAGGGSNSLAFRAKQITAKPSLWTTTPLMPAREELLDIYFESDLNQVAKTLANVIAKSHLDRNSRQAAEPNAKQLSDQTNLPLVIIGHSFGSVVAYRVVHYLTQAGIQPKRLVVLSFPAADRMSYDKQLHALSDKELIREVDELFGGVPENILDDEAALRFFVPALRFDLGMLERYHHDPDDQVLSTPITAICGTEDRAVDLADMQRWSQMTDAMFRLRSMPGDHFFPLERMAEVLQVATWDT